MIDIGSVSADNVWHSARERVGQTEGYMNDLARATRLVQVSDYCLGAEPGQYKGNIGVVIRCALMSTSLGDLLGTFHRL